MQRLAWTLVAMCVLAGTVHAGATNEKVISQVWEVSYLQGRRSGYARETVHEVNKGGQTIYRTTKVLVLNGKRFNTRIELQMDTGTEETKDGQVVGVFMRQYLGRQKRLEIRGTVKGNQIALNGPTGIKPAPWNPKAIGLRQQANLFQEHKVKPGIAFSFLSFEPSINLVIRTYVKAIRLETVELLGGRQSKKLLRVEIKPQPIEGVQLPTMISWLDDNKHPVRSEVLLPGLGLLTLYRTTKAEAMRPINLAQLPDIGFGQLVRVNRRITNPYNATAAVYRIKIKGEKKPATAFAKDLRQKVAKTTGDTIELHVSHGKAESSKKVADEFLQSSYFINSNNQRVKRLATTAIGRETDPLKKALRIERWVNQNMKSRNHEAMAPADHVAQTLEGDCSEFAMLMAAMCRAENIPARTAIGLIYANTPRGPAFSYHMWTEVWVDGHWLPLDATLGRGSVGATHLKITDHSWHDTRSLTPMLPLLRVLGKISIDVVRVQ